MTKVSEMVSRHAKISIFLLFTVLSVAAVGVYMVKGQILSINSNDLTFHLNRIETFRQAIIDGHGVAFRNFETFNKIGNAINFFNPYAYMYLWVGTLVYLVKSGRKERYEDAR